MTSIHRTGLMRLAAIARSDEEQADTLDIHEVERTIVYTVPLQVAAGDVAMVQARSQVSNKQSYNVMVGLYIIRALQPTDVRGATVMRATAQNVTPAMHHMVRLGQGIDEINTTGTVHYSVILYAAASRSEPGHVLEIDPYGEIVVTLWRNE